ncbi:MAG: hypothetical protein ACYCS9_09215 [Candidatus Dormibacteria bacterium]
MTAPRLLSAFGRFWWEFIVGDTPELALGVALVVLAAWGLAAAKVPIGAALLPVALLLLLTASLWRGRRPG